jgi:hypothetical protein
VGKIILKQILKKQGVMMQTGLNYFKFEALTVVITNSIVFWVVMLCSSERALSPNYYSVLHSRRLCSGSDWFRIIQFTAKFL